MSKVHLCLCNNCDSILEDTNPQVNASLYDVGTLEPKSLIQIEDMKACPFCKTDAYLQDDIGRVFDLIKAGITKV